MLNLLKIYNLAIVSCVALVLITSLLRAGNGEDPIPLTESKVLLRQESNLKLPEDKTLYCSSDGLVLESNDSITFMDVNGKIINEIRLREMKEGRTTTYKSVTTPSGVNKGIPRIHALQEVVMTNQTLIVYLQIIDTQGKMKNRFKATTSSAISVSPRGDYFVCHGLAEVFIDRERNASDRDVLEVFSRDGKLLLSLSDKFTKCSLLDISSSGNVLLEIVDKDNSRKVEMYDTKGSILFSHKLSLKVQDVRALFSIDGETISISGWGMNADDVDLLQVEGYNHKGERVYVFNSKYPSMVLPASGGEIIIWENLNGKSRINLLSAIDGTPMLKTEVSGRIQDVRGLVAKKNQRFYLAVQTRKKNEKDDKWENENLLYAYDLARGVQIGDAKLGKPADRSFQFMLAPYGDRIHYMVPIGNELSFLKIEN